MYAFRNTGNTKNNNNTKRKSKVNQILSNNDSKPAISVNHDNDSLVSE